MKKTAVLYRMLGKQHICPFGIKAKHLLEKQGYSVEDHPLKTREEIDAFKTKYDVKTTPQAFINGKRIGGYDDLVKHFDIKTLKQEGKTYQPIIAIFATTLCLAMAINYQASGSFNPIRILELFIATSMCALGMMKLRDLYSFSNQFIGYDLLAMKWPTYALIYPFVETLAGVFMVAGALIWLAAPAALMVGTIGALSVFKAVYIDKRDIKCACVGGNSNVPLGFISLTENLMMIAMAIWMLYNI